MKQALAECEAELDLVAEAFMTDPNFAECRDDEQLCTWQVKFDACLRVVGSRRQSPREG